MPVGRKIIVNSRRPESWEQDTAGYWYEQRISFKDPLIQLAATTVNYDITGIPGGVTILGGWFRWTANWTGGAIATATWSAGTTATPTAYVAAQSVFTGAPGVKPGAALQVPGTFVNAAAPLSSGTIRCQLIVTGANANALTTGYVDFYFWLQTFKLRAT
jgi:hypothetical protein